MAAETVEETAILAAAPGADATSRVPTGGTPALPGRGKADPGPWIGSGNLTVNEAWSESHLGPYKRFPPPREKIQDYLLMSQMEPEISRALGLIRAMVISRLGQYKHPVGAVSDQVNQWIGQMEGGAEKLVGDLLSGLAAGFTVLEPIWETSGSKWIISRCDLLHPLTFFNRRATRQEDQCGIKLGSSHRADATSSVPTGTAERRGADATSRVPTGTGRVEELVQFDEDGSDKRFPREALIYWPLSLVGSYREEVMGRSLLMGARRAWYSLVTIENMFNTWAEKAAMGQPWVFVPSQASIKDPQTMMEVPLGAEIAKRYKQMGPGGIVVLPWDAAWGPPPTPYFMTASDGAANGFRQVLSYWKDELYGSLNVPRILMEEPEHASRAQTSVVVDMFYQIMMGWRSQLGSVLVDQVAKPLIRYNIGPEAAMAQGQKWRFEPLVSADQFNNAQASYYVMHGLSVAAQTGFLSEALMRRICTSFDFMPDYDEMADELGNIYKIGKPEEPGGDGEDVARKKARRYAPSA